MRDLSQAEIEALLRRCKVGRIGIYDQHHQRTYVVPISYEYRAGAAYLHSAPGIKLDLLHEQPAGVCFEVDDIADEAPTIFRGSALHEMVSSLACTEILSDRGERSSWAMPAVWQEPGSPS